MQIVFTNTRAWKGGLVVNDSFTHSLPFLGGNIDLAFKRTGVSIENLSLFPK